MQHNVLNYRQSRNRQRMKLLPAYAEIYIQLYNSRILSELVHFLREALAHCLLLVPRRRIHCIIIVATETVELSRSLASGAHPPLKVERPHGV
jgi:hypothetical protein